MNNLIDSFKENPLRALWLVFALVIIVTVIASVFLPSGDTGIQVEADDPGNGTFTVYFHPDNSTATTTEVYYNGVRVTELDSTDTVHQFNSVLPGDEIRAVGMNGDNTVFEKSWTVEDK